MSAQPQHHQLQQYQAKFRWSESLTCRFIQLRKEHAKLFTGRKYSAQSGWEYILQQMRNEFPAIMADVHYRVLKKKWSNLLQQYKELKNPVYGDRNKSDDISWPFYNAIDQVLNELGLPRNRRKSSVRATRAASPNYCDNDDEDDDDDDDGGGGGDDNEVNGDNDNDQDPLDPQEFLCVSVADDDVEENDEDDEDDAGKKNTDDGKELVRGVKRMDRVPIYTRAKRNSAPPPPLRKRDFQPPKSTSEDEENVNNERLLLSRLPRTTELTIRPIKSKLSPSSSYNTSQQQQQQQRSSLNNARGQALKLIRDVKRQRLTNDDDSRNVDDEEFTAMGNKDGTRLERRIVEFMDYARRRDDENRAILVKMLEVVEDIRNAVS